MKTNLRNYAASALLLLPAAVAFTALPSTALAQSAMPEVRSLQATADGRIEAGTLLTFVLEGTPRAEASLRVRGLREEIALTETRRGEYVGRYTIKRGDRIDDDAAIRATMRYGNREASVNYALDQLVPRNRGPLPPYFAAPNIERFGIAPVDRIEPGVDIRFALEGTPGGTVTIDLPGVRNDLALREVRPGTYEGSYTIRRADNIDPRQPVVATLRIGERVATSNVPFPVSRPAGDNQPPQLVNLSPRDGDTIAAGPPVQVGASFDDGRGTGVDPASVQIQLSGRNVTRDAQINRQSFSLRAALPPGRHTVDVTARDLAGNGMRKTWSFNVATAVVAIPPPVAGPFLPPVVLGPAPLAVQVMNHYPNAEIGPDPVLVKGRTAPGATVVVSVQAVPPAPPAAGQARIVYAQTLQADNEGIFSFTMVPGTPYPGERYEIVMVARRGNLSQESRFTLIQRPG